MDFVLNSLTIHNQSTPRQLQMEFPCPLDLPHFHSTLTASMEFRCPSFYLTSGCTFARVFTPLLFSLDWKQFKPHNTIYTTSSVGQQHYAQRSNCPTPVVYSPVCPKRIYALTPDKLLATVVAASLKVICYRSCSSPPHQIPPFFRRGI